ncbi:MAG: radical SAM protein [Methanomicrobiales archaeon HGW-Methanomicrobiales-3]|jgi:wyosine [tRNA(Phe)-imidazoG37] synthetase (radical SAM superfamily)|nr:MAG: radical SAM protein [Methanomicrobiales archaeon HGW-Methanomicrobiales-3]
MAPKHIFGPVLSRRLGLSLGIDLVPYKTCSFNCAYCECGPEPFTTVIRKEFFPPEEVIAELEPVLASRPHLDSVTFAGSGEPTLSLSIGEIIAWVKRKYPGYTVSVLTNGSLLPDADVRAELLSADRVIPTLTSAFQPAFEQIHRPHPSFRIDTIIEGMVQFRKQYSGALWLEVFVIPGINTTDPELEGLKEAIQRIDPDLIQLNSLDRPAAEPWVAAATDTELDRVRKALGETGIEIVGRNHPVSPATLAATEATDLIRATLSRRSSTVEDLVHTTGLSGGEVAKILGTLERAGEITSQRGTRGVFYLFKNPDAMEMR